MIKVIMGKKGSGKTKQMIDMINSAVQTEHGNVVCIERGSKLTFDISHQIRLVESSEYDITSYTALKGFVSGMYAGNYDITHVYIDNLYKTIGADRAAGEEFILWCAKFAEANSMEITVTVSDDAAEASEAVKAYL